MTSAGADGTDGTVIVGCGLAGVTVAKRLRDEGYRDRIVLIGAEDEAPYDRPPLSKEMLTGSGDGRVSLLDPAQAAQAGIELMTARTATGLEPAARRVRLDGAETVGYDHCVIATGARARTIPALGAPSGLFYLRTIEDSRALRAALLEAGRVAVVGAGFIGLEVASAAVYRGIPVTVVEREAMPLSRVLGADAGYLARDLHVSHGVDLRCGVGVADVLTDAGRVRGLELTDGIRVPADVVVVGAGAVPNVEWLSTSGLRVDDGVVCDGYGRAGADGVWAAGDVSRWPNAVTGLHVRLEQWQAALDQAMVVAHNIAHPDGPRVWDSVPYFWSDQFGVKLQFCGHPGSGSRVVPTPRGPVVAFGSEDALSGVLAIGQPRALAHARRLVAGRRTWSELADLLGGTGPAGR